MPTCDEGGIKDLKRHRYVMGRRTSKLSGRHFGSHPTLCSIRSLQYLVYQHSVRGLLLNLTKFGCSASESDTSLVSHEKELADNEDILSPNSTNCSLSLYIEDGLRRHSSII